MLRSLRPVSIPDPPTTSAPDHPLDGGSALVCARGLGKRYEIYPNDRSRFFEFLGNRTHHTDHWAVRNVSFEVQPGRAFGVVGSNGAGKSTLLRLLAGISDPTEGTLSVRARMATLLDLGVGFHAPFSGRENIELGCALAGLTPAETERRIPEIIRFAELGDFIDHPVRTYSTGMQLRLGFAIAVHSDARVLLIDEVLAVGDQYFQRKCIRRIEQLIAEGCALLLVSHDLHAVRALCDEVLWMHHGQPRARGSAREVIEEYLATDRIAAPTRAVRPLATRSAEALVVPPPTPNVPVKPLDPTETLDVRLARACGVQDAARVYATLSSEAPRLEEGDALRISGTGEVRVLRVQLLDEAGGERSKFRTGESLIIAVTFRTTEPVEDPIFGAAIFRDDGVYVFGPNTSFDRVLKGTYNGVYTFYLHYPALPLLYGHYRISIAVYDKGHVRPYVWHNEMYGLTVEQDVEDHGLVRLPHTWGVLTWHEV